MRAGRRGIRAPRQDGFTLFELAVATIIAVLLSGLLLHRLHVYQEDAEQVSVGQLVSALRTALSVRSAQLAVAKMEHQLPLVIDGNPILLLASPPHNYLGEYYSPEGNTLPKGSWYFDRADRTLVYIVSRPKSFNPRRVELRKFKVEFSNLTLHKSKESGAPQMIDGAVLKELP